MKVSFALSSRAPSPPSQGQLLHELSLKPDEQVLGYR
jgi:hypothetical protein